jgi:hypothetical protein
MIPANPGNLLPAYLTPSANAVQRWQRHRLTGQDRIPFGLTAPRNRLLPMQFFVLGDAEADTIVWELRSPINDATTYILDPDLLTINVKADLSGYWITWKADQSIFGDTAPFYADTPPCGFWYPRFTVEGVKYDFEVLYLKDICGLDDAQLEIVPDSCSVDGSDLVFSLQATVFSAPGYVYSLQKFVLGWSSISDQETYEITLVEGNESASLRIEVETICGLVLTRDYDVTWTSGAACNTLTLSLVDEGQVAGLDVGQNPTWRMKFKNTQDKGNVLYSQGYEQWFYLNPIWDVPPIERNTEIEVDGNGTETRRFTRTVEKKRFEAADLPDYLLGFLAKAGDNDTINLEEIETGDTYTITNLTFESRRQGAELNIGIFTFDAEIEIFSGCQEAFVLD